MKKNRVFWFGMVVLFIAATILYVKMQAWNEEEPQPSDNGRWIQIPVDATVEQYEDAVKRGKDENKDIIQHLEPPLSEDELAALPDCDGLLDTLKVGPPLADKTRCRTAEGQATLLTIALEDSPKWEYVGPGEPMKRK